MMSTDWRLSFSPDRRLTVCCMCHNSGKRQVAECKAVHRSHCLVSVQASFWNSLSFSLHFHFFWHLLTFAEEYARISLSRLHLCSKSVLSRVLIMPVYWRLSFCSDEDSSSLLLLFSVSQTSGTKTDKSLSGDNHESYASEAAGKSASSQPWSKSAHRQAIKSHSLQSVGRSTPAKRI